MAKAPNLSKLSLAELKTLKRDIAKAITVARNAERKAALDAAKAAARKHGFALDELVGGKPRKKPSKPVAPKYRHPKDRSITWSGRGRQPVWFKAALKSGKKPDNLRV